MDAPAAAAAPGWYGKLPFLGDFASRRLPSSFVRTWDDWLQNVIYGSRALLGDQWLPQYLSSPVWRFCLAPGVCGNNAWFGLLMSSVDRANRHFPFTIAHAVPREALHDVAFGAMADWLSALETESIAMLDLEGSVQQLEDRLAAFRLPAGLDVTRPRVAENLSTYVDETRSIAASEVPPLLVALAGESQRAAGATPLSLWWTGADDAGSVLTSACRGLPAAERYSAMLGGA